MSKRRIAIAVTAISVILMVCYELFLGDVIFSTLDESVRFLVDMTVTRSLGAAVFITILVYLEFKVLNPIKAPLFKSFLFCLPAFAVAINNFPFSCMAKGIAVVDAPAWKIALLGFQCFAVALFEEMAFRGVIFLGFAEKRRSRLGLFISIILSSAVFAAVHLLNIFTSSPIAVIMQIGYSFLIGGMCSVILLKTKNIWLCVAVHAVFNFGGAIVATCGHGEIWDTFTVIFTAVLAVVTFVYMLVAFIKLDVSSTYGIYKK